MSKKLHDLAGKYSNLELRPVVGHAEVQAQIEKASIYLDINSGDQILGVVKTAYSNGLLVLALSDEAKVAEYSLNYDSIDQLAQALSAATEDSEGRSQLLRQLHEKSGPLATAGDYEELLEG